LLCAAGIDAKGSHTGGRGPGTMVTHHSYPRAYGIYPIGFYGHGYHYTRSDGKEYAPGYGHWSSTAGWNEKEQSCGQCSCPAPNPVLTKNWVWVQIKVSKQFGLDSAVPNATLAGSSGLDVTTFEVDAFKEIASITACLPPTQVLVLKLCKVDKTTYSTAEEWAKGGLDDRHLGKKCVTVGDEVTVHKEFRLRKLLADSVFVVQFVVGATSEGHGKFLKPYIKIAMNQSHSKLAKLYDIKEILSIEVEGPAPWYDWMDFWGKMTQETDVEDDQSSCTIYFLWFILGTIGLCCFAFWSFTFMCILGEDEACGCCCGPFDDESVCVFSPIMGIISAIAFGISIGIVASAGAGVTAAFLWGTVFSVLIGLIAGFCRWAVLWNKGLDEGWHCCKKKPQEPRAEAADPEEEEDHPLSGLRRNTPTPTKVKAKERYEEKAKEMTRVERAK